MKEVETTLMDRMAGQEVTATIRFGLASDEVLAAEARWGPVRKAGVARLERSGLTRDQMPDHWHWNWGRKVAKLGYLAYQGIGIEVGGEIQGLLLIATAEYESQLPGQIGQPLVYVDYIESAPWNVFPLAENPRFSGVGKRLIWAAVKASYDEGFAGRLGLHSLKQAESFYREKCRLISLGIDQDYFELEYFEMDTNRAAEILQGGNI